MAYGMGTRWPSEAAVQPHCFPLWATVSTVSAMPAYRWAAPPPSAHPAGFWFLIVPGESARPAVAPPSASSCPLSAWP